MSKEKQIEEMARMLAEDCGSCDKCMSLGATTDGVDCTDYYYARKLYNAGYRKQEWISVAERLPEIMETVLIVYKEKWGWETEWHFDVDAGSWDIVEGRWNTYHDLDEGQELHITHWMPLPEAPKIKGGAE